MTKILSVEELQEQLLQEKDARKLADEKIIVLEKEREINKIRINELVDFNGKLFSRIGEEKKDEKSENDEPVIDVENITLYL